MSEIKRNTVTDEYHTIDVDGSHDISEIIDHLNDAVENGCNRVSFTGESDEDGWVYRIDMSMETDRPENDEEYNYRKRMEKIRIERSEKEERKRYEILKAKYDSNE